MGWLPYAIIGAQAGFEFLKKKRADNRAAQEHRAKINAYRNDPKVLMRNALINELFDRNPDWAQRFPGVRFALLHPPNPLQPQGTASLWDAIGQGAIQAGRYHSARQEQKNAASRPPAGGSSTSVSSDASSCPAGEVYVAGYGCI